MRFELVHSNIYISVLLAQPNTITLFQNIFKIYLLSIAMVHNTACA